MRKVFLDDLPKKIRAGKETIDWINSVGYKVPFIYDEIKGEIEIVDYDSLKQRLIIKYSNETTFKIKTKGLKNCELGKLLGKITVDFRFEIGKIFKDKKRDLIITDKKREEKHFIDKEGYNCVNKQKWYKYKCNKCGWTEGWVTENDLNKGVGCSCCSGKTIVLGINTIWDLNRDWVDRFGISEEDAKTHTKGSGETIEVTCPNCGNIKKIKIDTIRSNKSIGCACSDGLKYPEKFMLNILTQLKIQFITQYSPKWASGKRYDFYLPECNMIIETHGRQHYKACSNFKRSLKEEQENDRVKNELALSNGIEKYIIVNCSYSEFDWMKFNVYKSLKDYFDTSDIDFGKAEEFALKNIVKEVCEYWNNKQDWETTNTIAKSNPWGIKSKETIIKYLKKGVKLGWANYNPKEEMKKSALKHRKTNSRSVEIFKGDVSLGVFESFAELERQSEERFGVKIGFSGISMVCRGTIKSYKGFTFKYLENID